MLASIKANRLIRMAARRVSIWRRPRKSSAISPADMAKIVGSRQRSRDSIAGQLADNAVLVSTVEPFHNSIGDISTAIVTQHYLASRGVPCYSGSFWNGRADRPIVIGGGELMSLSGGGGWEPVKAQFFPAGPHILNAVGTNLKSIARDDLSFLREYRYLGVRDNQSVQILQDRGYEATAVPCPATLQDGIPLDILVELPRFERLKELEPSGFIVIHKHPLLSACAKQLRRLGIQFVVVDMQAHARHRWTGGGTVLPSVHSTSAVKGLVDESLGVITVSLHLAIFAIGARKPFAALSGFGEQHQKMARYLERAELADTQVEGAELIERCLQYDGGIERAQKAEIAAAWKHLDKVREAAGEGPVRRLG